MEDKRQMDGTKALWHMDRIIQHYDRGERIPPVHIDWGLTKICNIDCIYCYGKYQSSAIGQHGINAIFQKDALLSALREAGKEGVRSVAFIGDGEPTCNPAWKEAMYVGKNSGLDLAISTNGVLVDNDEARRAILDNATWMRFCLSAGTREGYKKIHRRDKFDVVVKNIEQLVNMRDRYNYKTDIGLQSVFVPTLMAEEMVKESELARKIGVDYFVIKQCSLPDEGQSGMMQFDLKDYDKPHIIDTLKKCEEMSNDRTKIVVKWQAIKGKGKKNYSGCLAVPLISEISGNGDWYPGGCMFGNKMYDNLKFGNLHEKGFSEILNSERYWSIIRQMKDYDVRNSPACRGACRLDPVNQFVYKYLNKPKGINFI